MASWSEQSFDSPNKTGLNYRDEGPDWEDYAFNISPKTSPPSCGNRNNHLSDGHTILDRINSKILNPVSDIGVYEHVRRTFLTIGQILYDNNAYRVREDLFYLIDKAMQGPQPQTTETEVDPGAKLTRLCRCYGIQEKAGKSEKTITLRRLMMAFPDVTQVKCLNKWGSFSPLVKDSRLENPTFVYVIRFLDVYKNRQQVAEEAHLYARLVFNQMMSPGDSDFKPNSSFDQINEIEKRYMLDKQRVELSSDWFQTLNMIYEKNPIPFSALLDYQARWRHLKEESYREVNNLSVLTGHMNIDDDSD